MTHQEQVDELNQRVKTRLAPSKIHGVGVFALRDIYKGQNLFMDFTPVVYTLPYANFKELFPEVRQLLLERWPRVVKGSRFAFPTERLQALMNHADDPNYDAQNDLALRDIKQGEEITEDYRLIPGYEIVHPWLGEKKSLD